MNPANDRQLIVVFLGICFVVGILFLAGYVQLGTAEQRIIETCKEAR